MLFSIITLRILFIGWKGSYNTLPMNTELYFLKFCSFFIVNVLVDTVLVKGVYLRVNHTRPESLILAYIWHCLQALIRQYRGAFASTRKFFPVGFENTDMIQSVLCVKLESK